MNRQTLLAIILLILASVPALFTLSIDEFYTSHDGLTHTARIANYYLALKEGQLPPRLAPRLFFGFGYPIFIFIYPIPYLFAAALHMLGATFTDSFEVVIGASFLLSSLTMFFFAKSLFGIWPGFLAALFYSWAPYRFSQIYVRGAIAESFAYIFIPLVLLSLTKLSLKAEKRWIGIGSLSLAGLLLSHQLVSLMFLPVILAFALILLRNTSRKRDMVSAAGVMLILGAAISAFIYFPTLFERKYLRFDELIGYYADHFVTVAQLIHSPWDYGFSMSGSQFDGMSFQVGLTHLLVAAISTIYLAFLLLTRKKQALSTPHFLLGALSLALFFLSLGLMIEHPFVRFIWERVPGISIVDFPWRFLGVTVFSSSLLAAYLADRLPMRLGVYAVLLFFVFYANRNHIRINQTIKLDDDFFLNYSETATWKNEFLPKWRETNKGANVEGDIHVEEGSIVVKPLVSKTHQLSFSLEAKDAGTVVIHRLYFPGWKVWLDQRELKLDGEYTITQDIKIETATTPYSDQSGFLRIRIPKGEHTLIAKFEDTRVRKLGMLTTAGGVVASVALLTSPKKRKPRRER